MATIKDVAHEAGVSVTLVSRYINGKPGVGKDSAAAIAAAIEKLRYQPNQLARSLVQGSTRTLAVLLDSLDDPGRFPLLRGIEVACQEKGYYAAFFSAGGDAERKTDILRAYSSGRVDGVLVQGSANAQTLAEGGVHVPLVAMEGSLAGCSCHRVCIDYRQGGYTLTRHMLGSRSWICLFMGAADDPVAQALAQGYAQAVRDAEGEDRIHQVPCGTAQRDGYETMRRLMGKGILPHGVIACSQAAAMGAMRALLERGRSLPQDMLFAGFGGEEVPQSKGYPALTTLRLPWEEIGRQAVELFLWAREHPEEGPQTWKVPPVLVPRESSHSPMR